jgi:hypothetical protein
MPNVIKVIMGSAHPVEMCAGKSIQLEVDGIAYIITALDGCMLITACTTMNAAIAVRPCASNSIQVFQP